MRFVAATLAGALLLAGPVAAQIPIVNPGFEAVVTPPGTFPVGAPPGWSVVDPGNILDNALDAVGTLNPTGTTFFPGGAPEGSNVGLIYLSGDQGTTPVSLTQVLTATLQPLTTYSLTVSVGNIASGFGAPPFDQFFDLSGFPGYRVQLLAGGVVIAEDDNSLSIAEGTFATSSIQAVIGAAHPQLGQALEVRLTNLNQIQSQNAPGIEVDFDDVRLNAQPNAAAPEPASLALALPALGLLALRRRRSAS